MFDNLEVEAVGNFWIMKIDNGVTYSGVFEKDYYNQRTGIGWDVASYDYLKMEVIDET